MKKTADDIIDKLDEKYGEDNYSILDVVNFTMKELLPEWIKIESEEDLPKEYGDYIVRLKSDKVKGAAYYAESKRFYTGGNINDNPVTHWMNFPQSPKED